MSTTVTITDQIPQIAGLLDALLIDQQKLSAVEAYAAWHDQQASPTQAPYYRALIPSRAPNALEQFAFDVDLDACSGCKACVTACHNLNGLEPQETWRSVGQLNGGTAELPVLLHVTTACHHCLEPACLQGCPVDAYEKDPVTGIVRHLDDQCIGCQYCILKCPYDVPKYSASKGIVRKCDMCSTRLASGEAPACVQACPNQAIRISIVHRQQVAEECEANLFLPGAPEPSYTLPTTLYRSSRPLPRNLLPADYFAARPQHAHWPLILMLVFTQASVGALVVDLLFDQLGLTTGAERGVHRLAAFVLGGIGLTASIFHLGRPWYAFRALIGLRTSWLSREIVAFGLFALLASLYAAVPIVERLGVTIAPSLDLALGWSVALCGLGAVLCSAMIYVSTRRSFWQPGFTIPKFLLSCLVLGLPIALGITLMAAASSPDRSVSAAFQQVGPLACSTLIIVTTAKLLLEAVVLSWLRAPRFTPLKRTATLMVGELGLVTFQRFLLGTIGGIALPWLLASYTSRDTNDLAAAWFLGLIGLLAMMVTTAGEIIERYLFFTAVVAPKMPGVPAS